MNIKANFLVATISMVTLLSSAKAACPDCSKHADGALLRDPTSCSHYYKCVKGLSEHKSCGSGFYFDERFLICNFAAFVDCKIPGVIIDKPKKTQKPTCKPTTTTCAPEPTIAIDPEPCEPVTEPVTCEPTTPKPEHCVTSPPPCDHNPSRNFVVDTLHHRSDCKSRNDGTFLFHASHCRRYYVCQSGRAKLRNCPYGQWFDGHTKTCRSQRDVTNCPANKS